MYSTDSTHNINCTRKDEPKIMCVPLFAMVETSVKPKFISLKIASLVLICLCFVSFCDPGAARSLLLDAAWCYLTVASISTLCSTHFQFLMCALTPCISFCVEETRPLSVFCNLIIWMHFEKWSGAAWLGWDAVGDASARWRPPPAY